MNPLSRLVIGFGFRDFGRCPTRSARLTAAAPWMRRVFSRFWRRKERQAPGAFHIVAEVTGPHRIEVLASSSH